VEAHRVYDGRETGSEKNWRPEGDGAALDLDSRSYPILLLEETVKKAALSIPCGNSLAGGSWPAAAILWSSNRKDGRSSGGALQREGRLMTFLDGELPPRPPNLLDRGAAFGRWLLS